MNWQAPAERLLRTIAPEDTEGITIYLVDEKDVSDESLHRLDALGWTAPAADYLLAEHLIDADQWRGPGFATVISSGRIEDWPKLLGTVLHEFSHYLTYKPSRSVADPSSYSVALRAFAELQKIVIERPRQSRWHNHEADFIRAATHAWHRANQHVQAITPEHVNFAEPYFGFPFTEQAFVDALSGELTQSGSIRDILDTPQPERFAERYRQAAEDQ